MSLDWFDEMDPADPEESSHTDPWACDPECECDDKPEDEMCADCYEVLVENTEYKRPE